MLLALALMACGSDLEPGADPPTDSVPPTDSEPPTASDPPDADTDPPTLAAQVEAARAALAASTGVAAGDIEVIAADHVTWPDGSLGCPQPDEMYTQALVDGYRIRLRVGDDEVQFHGQDGGEPFRCDDPAPPVDR